jgi:hypothetical protein
MRDISDRKLIDLARLAQDLPDYRKKELAILIISDCLRPGSVERLAKEMVTLSEDDDQRAAEMENQSNQRHEDAEEQQTFL